MSTNADAASGSPILRMARGNYLLWSTTAKKVCQWRPAELTTDAANADYWFGAKLVAYFERDAALPDSDLQGMPSHAVIAPYDKGLASDLPPNTGSNGLAIRVQACASVDLIGKENCKRFEYKDANGVTQVSLKPSGILLDYGFARRPLEAARAEFGLISGSYDNNLSGGVLRKNVSNLNDEVNSNGTFCHTAGGCNGSGIIKSFDAFRLYRRRRPLVHHGRFVQMGHAQYIDQQTVPFLGNPLGEMLVEALSYFSNQGKSSYDNVQPVSIDAALGLPLPAWADPLNDGQAVPGAGDLTRGQVYGKSFSRPMNTLAISSSALSFDRDEVRKFGSLPNRTESRSCSQTRWASEGINGTVRSVASVTPDLNNGDGGWGEQCTGKTVTHLWEVSGVCPEAPATRGSYLSAGAALYGNTRAIRDTADMTLPPDLPGYALRVKTLAAAMGEALPALRWLTPVRAPRCSSHPKAYGMPGARSVAAMPDARRHAHHQVAQFDYQRR